MRFIYTLRVEQTYVGVEPIVSQQRDELIVTPEGIHKDRHFGFTKLAGVREKKFYEKGTIIRNNRQWSAVYYGDLYTIAREMGIIADVAHELLAKWMGANLLLSGGPQDQVNLSKLPLGSRLEFSDGTALVVYGENLPCIGPADAMATAEPEKIGQKSRLFGKAALNRRGLVGWVERGGVIRPGDEVKVLLP